MTYTWYKIFNLNEFEVLALCEKTYTVLLDDVTEASVMITKSNCVSMYYNGVFLPLELNGSNPFYMDSYGAFIDPNGDVYLGIGVEEDDES